MNTIYAKCNLIDDHTDRGVADQLLGLVLTPGAVPVLVRCFTQGRRYLGPVSLNEVIADPRPAQIQAMDYDLDMPPTPRHAHQGHITRRSVLVLSGDSLAELHDRGQVRVSETTRVVLLPQPVPVLETTALETDEAAHDRGGPLPTLPPGLYHARLARVIQQARGRIHDGVDPMEVGAYLADQVFGAPPFDRNDLMVAIAYLLKAAQSQARVALLAEQRKYRQPPAG